MRLIWHLARTDLRRFRWLMLMWVALTVCATLLEGLAPAAVFRGMAPVVGFSGVALAVARALLGAVIIAAFIHAHRLVGTTAFWTTRPVPRGMLLGAKLLTLGILLIGVPAICDSVLMAVYRVPAGDAILVLLEASLFRAGVVLVLVVIAALTVDLTRFTLACGALMVTVVMVMNLLVLVLAARPASVGVLVGSTTDRALSTFEGWPDQTPALVAWGMLMVGALFVLRTAYRTRSRIRAGGVIVVVLLAAVIVAAVWPWPLLHAEPAPPSWAAALRLSGPPQAVFFDNAGAPNLEGPRWRTAHARVYLQGVPAGWYVTARLLRATLTYDGSSVTSAASPGSGPPPTSPDGPAPLDAAIQHALGAWTVSDRWSFSASLPILRLPQAHTPAATARGQYSGEFELTPHHFELATLLPLEPGATFQEGSYRLVIAEVLVRDDGPAVLAQVSRTTSTFDLDTQPSYSFYLRHARAREAIAGHQYPTGMPTTPPGGLVLGPYGYIGLVHGFFLEAHRILFPSTYAARLPSARSAGEHLWSDEDWLKGAELAVVRMTRGGRVIRSLELPELTINPRQ